MSVTVWAARLTRPLTESEAERLLDCLPPARRKRLEQVQKKREEVLCAYGLLCRALREQCGWEELPEICLAEKGKPYFPAFPEIRFSISHTEGAVLAGIGRESVGVDLEKIRPVSRRMLERFSAEEKESFFRSWVRREARGKCSGAGIAPMLREEPSLGANEAYFELDVFPGYTAGVAVEGFCLPPDLRIVPLEELLT